MKKERMVLLSVRVPIKTRNALEHYVKTTKKDESVYTLLQRLLNTWAEKHPTPDTGDV